MTGIGNGLAERLRELYPAGSRVVLDYLDDPYRKIPAGTMGTVKRVDDAGTIHVQWDGWCSLGIVYGVDCCTVVKEEKDV